MFYKFMLLPPDTKEVIEIPPEATIAIQRAIDKIARNQINGKPEPLLSIKLVVMGTLSTIEIPVAAVVPDPVAAGAKR